MKNKQTTKSRSALGLTRHLLSGVLCLAVIGLICSSASAQNLFVSDSVHGNYGNIDEFTPNGVRSTFASGFNDPLAWPLTAGAICLWRMEGVGGIYKFTPAGVRTTFASGYVELVWPLTAQATCLWRIDVQWHVSINLLPTGARNTFATCVGCQVVWPLTGQAICLWLWSATF